MRGLEVFFIFHSFSSETSQHWCQETKSKETTFRTKKITCFTRCCWLIHDWFKSSVNSITFLSNSFPAKIFLILSENFGKDVNLISKYAHFLSLCFIIWIKNVTMDKNLTKIVLINSTLYFPCGFFHQSINIDPIYIYIDLDRY